ncbi:MAG: ABC transporter ATP-binding protein/permease [Aerococcus sp.]|nr:ABC transporter ATP-binding protein/permease [Aerococcus sp.]
MFDILKKLSWFFKMRWKSYGIAVLCLFITAICNAAVPYIVGQVTDQVIGGSLTYQLLLFETLAIVGLAIAMYILRYVWRNAIFGNSTLLESILRNRLFDHFTKMDSQFYHKYRTGDLMAHATNDLNALKFVAGGGIISIADTFSQGGVTLVSMILLIDWRLTLLTILPLPLLIVITQALGKIVNRRYSHALAAFSNMNNHVQESIGGIKVIKSFGEEDDDNQDFQRETEQVVEANRQAYKVDSINLPIIKWIMGLTYCIAIIFGTYLIVGNEITIGQLISFFSYLGMMQWPFIALGRLVNTLQRGNASYDRISELLDEVSHIKQPDHPVFKRLEGNITFDVDAFQYPDGDEQDLSDVHFQLEAGKTLGIAGRTGSGKSTIFKLLMHEYDNYRGKIAYGSTDLRDYASDSLSQSIGYVPQDNFLFSTTIRENIRFGRPELSDDDVRRYAEMADIDEDIINFPEGYDTKMGERGVSLSGGQKQRIALARALALDPEILILDDSLSAVDAKTESEILANLKRLRQNRTTIIAAHRLSSIMHADEIIVVDNGRIVERGTHEILTRNDGWYHDMFQQQQLEQEMQGEAEES